MKIFRPKIKPKRWEIVFNLTLIFIGFVCKLAHSPEGIAFLCLGMAVFALIVRMISIACIRRRPL